MLKVILLTMGLFSISVQASWVEGPDAEKIYNALKVKSKSDCINHICLPDDIANYSYKSVEGLYCHYSYDEKFYSCYMENVKEGKSAEFIYHALEIEPVFEEYNEVFPKPDHPRTSCRFNDKCNSGHWIKSVGPLSCTKTYLGEYYEVCDRPWRCSKAPLWKYENRCTL